MYIYQYNTACQVVFLHIFFFQIILDLFLLVFILQTFYYFKKSQILFQFINLSDTVIWAQISRKLFNTIHTDTQNKTTLIQF